MKVGRKPFTCVEPREEGAGRGRGREGEKKLEETLGWREEGTRDNLIQLQTRRPGR